MRTDAEGVSVLALDLLKSILTLYLLPASRQAGGNSFTWRRPVGVKEINAVFWKCSFHTDTSWKQNFESATLRQFKDSYCPAGWSPSGHQWGECWHRGRWCLWGQAVQSSPSHSPTHLGTVRQEWSVGLTGGSGWHGTFLFVPKAKTWKWQQKLKQC